jgi:hypothetical protein
VVTGTYSDGSTRSHTSEAAYAAAGGTVTTGGLYTAGYVPGGYIITAAFGGFTAEGLITVASRPPLVALRIVPLTVRSDTSATTQFTVTGTYGDGTVHDLTTIVTYRASGGQISPSGAYRTDTIAGLYSVAAFYGGQGAEAAVTVAPGPSGRVRILSVGLMASTLTLGGTVVYRAVVENDTAEIDSAYIQGYLTQGSTTRPAGFCVVVCAVPKPGVLPRGVSVSPFSINALRGVFVPGPAIASFHLRTATTIYDAVSVPIVLISSVPSSEVQLTHATLDTTWLPVNGDNVGYTAMLRNYAALPGPLTQVSVEVFQPGMAQNVGGDNGAVLPPGVSFRRDSVSLRPGFFRGHATAVFHLRQVDPLGNRIVIQFLEVPVTLY